MLRIRLLIVLAIVLTVSTCTESPDCLQEQVFCAALVTDTRGLNDFGLNEDTWAGLEESRAEGVVHHTAYIESVDARDYEKNIAFFINAGYDVIVTSGIGLRDATQRSADLYPDAVFIGMNQPDEDSKPNFIAVTFPEDQMGFMAGALAAHLTQTGNVGAVCETSGIDAMWRYCEGFHAGAAYVNEEVEVLVVYRDDGSREKLFIDPVWGFENAQHLIRDGVDMLFAAGGETAVGALRAAAQAKVRAIGAERDQGAALGEEGLEVLTSVLGRAGFTTEGLMRQVRAGNLTDAELSPVGYIALAEVVQQNIVMEMDKIRAGLENGEIRTGVTLMRP